MIAPDFHVACTTLQHAMLLHYAYFYDYQIIIFIIAYAYGIPSQ